MRALAEAFPDRDIVQQVIAQLPWGHAITLHGGYQGIRSVHLVCRASAGKRLEPT